MMKAEDMCYGGGNIELDLKFLSNLLYVGYSEQIFCDVKRFERVGSVDWTTAKYGCG